MSWVTDLFFGATDEVDPIAMNGAATQLNVASKLFGAISTVQAGDNRRAAAEFQATQLRAQAGDAVAIAQRAAWIEDRNARYVQSAALAAAAASGGGASDPTVVNIIAGIAQEGAYRHAIAFYGGESRASALRLQADAKNFEGESSMAVAGQMAAAELLQAGGELVRGKARERDIRQRTKGPSNLLQSTQSDSSMLERFGGGGPTLGNSNWSYD
jgi:hypothetical protein